MLCSKLFLGQELWLGTNYRHYRFTHQGMGHSY